MSDNTTNMNAETVKASVEAFKTAAKNLNDSLTDAKAKITNTEQQTESVFIQAYATKYKSFFDGEVTAAVDRINKTAGQLAEISGLITTEDTKEF